MILDGFDATSFGTLNADEYDLWQDPGTTDDCVAFLWDLASKDRVLELAIGTGRVALPLKKMGMDISGLEASPEMIAKMREKSGGDDIPVTIGDMAQTDLGQGWGHIFLVYNTLFNLPDQESQIRCFEQVARALKPGGTFLIECFVPDFRDFNHHKRSRPRHMDMHSLTLDCSFHDPVAQRIDSQRLRVTAEGVKLIPLPMRYAWPAELDLMARLAGLSLKDRWGGWDRGRFGPNSTQHISLYQKPEKR